MRQLRHGICGYHTSPPPCSREAVAAKEYAEAAWLHYDKPLAPVNSLGKVVFDNLTPIASSVSTENRKNF